ncbi:MAG: phosphocholine cytidylyltransferase family protein [Firmicutes bacterium]|nr:phosphocholine cytidylyltransferase family protein [Bacillota bacterium]
MDSLKAILLNSGLGKRMGAQTHAKPKCMVEIAPAETIISRQIKQLLAAGINDIIVTTGPFAEQLQDYLAATFPNLPITYVANPRYASTNYIVSLLLAKEYLTSEFLLLHGDLVFEDTLLTKTLQSTYANTVLVNPHAPLPEKDFKAQLQDNLIKKISIDIFGDDCAFLIPLYKISHPLSLAWLAMMEQFVNRNEVNVYAENALNVILSTQALHPVSFGDELCTEIDNLADLAKVKAALTMGE